MQMIRNALPKALETLGQGTRESPENTPTPQALSAPAPKLEFQTFSDPTLEQMAQRTEEFCRDMFVNHNPRWLSFLGKAGTGKTHLAKRINRYFQKHLEGQLAPGQKLEKTRNRMRGGFVPWRKLANDLRSGCTDILQDLEEDWFVALDDIGSEYRSKSDYLASKLDQLLDGRLRKWTVITANLSLEEIGQFMDVRIASRILRGGSEVIDVNVKDYNLR